MSVKKNKNDMKEYSDSNKKPVTTGKIKKMKIKEKQGDSDENSEVKIDVSIINEIIEDKYDELFFNRNKTLDEGLKLFLNNKLLSCLLLETNDKNSNNYVVKLIERNFEGKISVIDTETVDDMKNELRKGVYVTFKNESEVFEGEVVSINMDNTKDIEVILKTNKSSKTIKLDRRLKNGLSNINIGDVVYVEPNSGFLKRLGRSENCMNEYDLEGDKYVQLTKQSVNTRRKKIISISLYEMDLSINGFREEIDDIVRSRTNEIVEEYLESGAAVLKNSCVVVFLSEQLDNSKIRNLVKFHEEMAWLKIILVGMSKEYDSTELREFAKMKVFNLDGIDYLKIRHSNFNDYEDVVSEYIEKVPVEVISDLIKISSNKDDFKKYVESICLK